MEKLDYTDETQPKWVADIIRRELEERATKIIEREYRKSLDHDEMLEIENWQNVWVYNFLR